MASVFSACYGSYVATLLSSPSSTTWVRPSSTLLSCLSRFTDVISAADNYKNWKETVEINPLYVVTISGPVFLAVDTFLLLG